MVDLRIRRLRNRIRWRGDGEGGRRFAEGLDGTAAGELRRALAAVVGDWNLDPSVQIAVRRLRLRLRVHKGVGQDEIAAGWARAIDEALRRYVPERPADAALPVLTDDVAMFRSRDDLEIAYLEARGAAAVDDWWWPALMGDEDRRLPEADSVVSAWFDDGVSRGAANVTELAQRAARALNLIGESTARRLSAALERSKRNGAGADEPGASPSGPVGEGQVTPSVAHPLAALENRAPRAPSAILTGIDDRRTLRRFVAGCLFAHHLPALRGVNLRAAIDRCVDGSGSSTDGTAVGDADETGRFPGSSSESLREQPTDDAGDDVRLRPDREHVDEAFVSDERGAGGEEVLPEGDTVEVSCGGLLLLLRALMQTELWKLDDPLEFEEMMTDAATAALDRVLAPLEQRQREMVFEANRPLVQVFAGRRSLPDDWWEGGRASLAECVVETVAGCVPPETRLYEPGLRPAGLTEAHVKGLPEPDRRLAALLLRPGVLELTETRAELTLPLESVDIALRKVAWDTDPGWVARLGRVVRIHYVPIRQMDSG